jgi:hypothetical protein
MNQADPFCHFSPKPQQPSASRRVTNFLEAFKENAGKKPAETVATGNFLEAFKKNSLKGTDVVPTRGDLQPGETLPVADVISMEERRRQEEEARTQEALMARQREEEERARFRAKQEQVVKQIEAIREAILKIAKKMHNVGMEFEKAAFEAPVNPGTYHVTFFEKLKLALEVVKKRLDESASWLHVYNKRKKNMPFFWQQVQKSGTKYMLSAERYMQMAAG